MFVGFSRIFFRENLRFKAMNQRLLLLRHGQSIWNLENRFTGWYDSPLSEHGRAEAIAAGKALKSAQLIPQVIHTSVLTRAIETAELAGREVFEVDNLSHHPTVAIKRDWRLNERHYGNLTGLNKAETAEQYGDQQVHIWRRSYLVQPPPITDDNPWNPNQSPLYSNIPNIPKTECLADVTKRMLPCFNETIAPDLLAGKLVLVVAHGNSLRALVKHLDNISDDAIASINIPTGIVFMYELDSDLRPSSNRPLASRYLK